MSCNDRRRRYIRKATANRVAKEGAHVVCAALSEDAMQATTGELIKLYGVGIGVDGGLHEAFLR